LLLHSGSKKMLKPEKEINEFRNNLKSTLIWSAVYTAIIYLLIYYGILSFPTNFLEKLN